MNDEQVGFPAPGAAPIMHPDRRPPGSSHWCAAVGSTVYVLAEECPYCENVDETADEKGGS